MSDDVLKFNSKEFRSEVVKVANEVFYGGIYVFYSRSKIHYLTVHPCGYDFIDFSMVDDIEKYKFDKNDISNGIYDYHPLENKTLNEILNIVGEKGWSIEL